MQIRRSKARGENEKVLEEKNYVESHLQEGGRLSRDICKDLGWNDPHRGNSRHEGPTAGAGLARKSRKASVAEVEGGPRQGLHRVPIPCPRVCGLGSRPIRYSSLRPRAWLQRERWGMLTLAAPSPTLSPEHSLRPHTLCPKQEAQGALTLQRDKTECFPIQNSVSIPSGPNTYVFFPKHQLHLFCYFCIKGSRKPKQGLHLKKVPEPSLSPA